MQDDPSLANRVENSVVILEKVNLASSMVFLKTVTVMYFSWIISSLSDNFILKAYYCILHDIDLSHLVFNGIKILLFSEFLDIHFSVT